MSVPLVALSVAIWNGLKSAWTVVPDPATIVRVVLGPPAVEPDVPVDELHPARATAVTSAAVQAVMAPARDFLLTSLIFASSEVSSGRQIPTVY